MPLAVEKMSLPRRLTLAGDDAMAPVRIEPAGDTDSLRFGHQRVEGLNLPANQDVLLEGIRGNAVELAAEIQPQGAQMIEVSVLRSPNREEVTRIMVFPERGYRHREYTDKRGSLVGSMISIDTSCSSTLADARSRAPETAEFHIEKSEPLKLRVFIDRSVVEVFANGRQCVAVRVYPGREDSLGVSLRAHGKDAMLKSLDAWQMKSIYE